MNGHVFRHAIRQTIRTAAIVAIGLGIFYWVILLSSSSFAGDTQNIPRVLVRPPRAMTAFVGGATDFLRPTGWLAAGMYHPVVLALSTVGAVLVPAGFGVSELERGTLDLVLSRPVGRTAFLASKAAATLVILTIVQVGGLAGTAVARQTIRRVDVLPWADIFLVFAVQWLLFVGFAMIALWIFARSHLRSSAVGATVGVIVGAFFVNFVALLFDEVDWMRFGTPFSYFRPQDVLRGDAIARDVVVLAGVAVVAGVVAWLDFTRRDLTR